MTDKDLNATEEGQKADSGKQGWYPMPLVVLRPLADTFLAGEKKYATFNCLQPFKDSDRRFWDSTMRHLELCQLDPLAIDPETGCYHAAEACFGMLMRIFNAKRSKEEAEEAKRLRGEPVAWRSVSKAKDGVPEIPD